MLVALAETKKYLRVDYEDEDTLIRKFIRTAAILIRDTLRVDTVTPSPITRTACLYAVAYLFEHRENADMDELTRNLRYMLSSERKAAF